VLTVSLGGGMGDCIAAAAAVQYKARNENTKIYFNGPPSLQPILKNHLDILLGHGGEEEVALKWGSQYEENIWHLHIKQKYSYQLGFFIDPTYTVDIFDESGEVISCDESEKHVLINSLSSLPSKRAIPLDIIERVIVPMLVERGYTYEFIGSHYGNLQNFSSGKSLTTFRGQSSQVSDSDSDIESCIQKIKKSKLFIGPISGMAYLAEALGIPRMIFCSSVPYFKDMSFEKLTPIMQQEPCILDCEHARSGDYKHPTIYEDMGCEAINCKASFSINEIARRLEELL
jgi:ADP-heptose:LPS heptosyltransferase